MDRYKYDHGYKNDINWFGLCRQILKQIVGCDNGSRLSNYISTPTHINVQTYDLMINHQLSIVMMALLHRAGRFDVML